MAKRALVQCRLDDGREVCLRRESWSRAQGERARGYFELAGVCWVCARGAELRMKRGRFFGWF